MKAAILYKANKPLQVVDCEHEPPKARRGPREGQGRGHLPQRLAHHERGLDAAAADGPGPRGGGHRRGGAAPGVTNVKPGDHIIFSFRPQCGRCLYCSIGRSILCDGHTSPRWAHARRHLPPQAQRAGHLPDGAHRHVLRAGGVPGRDAGAHPQGDAVAAGGAGRLLRAHRRRRGHPLRRGRGGRLGARDRLRRRGAQRGAGRAAGRAPASSSPPTCSTTSSPTPRSSARPTRSTPRARTWWTACAS